MRISGSRPSMPELPSGDAVEQAIQGELLAKDQEQMRANGREAIKLIESAAVGVNRPLSSGTVGRTINIKI